MNQKIRNVIFIAAICSAAMALISVVLPYVTSEKVYFRNELELAGLSTFGASKHALSLFSYALTYADRNAPSWQSYYLFYSVLIFILIGFAALTVLLTALRKQIASIVCSAIVFALNLLIVWDFCSRRIISLSGSYAMGKAGAGLYMIFIFSAAVIVLDIILLKSKR